MSEIPVGWARVPPGLMLGSEIPVTHLLVALEQFAKQQGLVISAADVILVLFQTLILSLDVNHNFT